MPYISEELSLDFYFYKVARVLNSQKFMENIIPNYITLFNILISFLKTNGVLTGLGQQWTEPWTLNSNESLLSDISAYVPTYYNWWMFGLG